MKIFLFCIMASLDGDITYYKYGEHFESQFECSDRARVEAKVMSDRDTSHMSKVDFACMTSEDFVERFVK